MIIKWSNLLKIFRLFVDWHLQEIVLKFIVIFPCYFFLLFLYHFVVLFFFFFSAHSFSSQYSIFLNWAVIRTIVHIPIYFIEFFFLQPLDIETTKINKIFEWMSYNEVILLIIFWKEQKTHTHKGRVSERGSWKSKTMLLNVIAVCVFVVECSFLLLSKMSSHYSACSICKRIIIDHVWPFYNWKFLYNL